MQASRCFLYVCFFIFCIACDRIAPQSQKKDSYSLQEIKNEEASFFKIYKEKKAVVLVTYLNVAKTDSVVYVLYPNEKPDFSFQAFYIKTPVRSVACLASVFIGSLANLNVLDCVTAVDNADFIYNADILKKCAVNQIKQVSKTGSLNIEQTLVCKPAVLFTNPGGDTKKDFDERLIKADIIPVVCADYFETSPLARAEWVKALALFFNKEEKADSLFRFIKNRYQTLKHITDTCLNKPTVFTELKTGDVWYVAGSESNMAQMLRDAGAHYVFDDNHQISALSYTIEQVLTRARATQYWLHLHEAETLSDVLKQDARYAVFSAFKNKKLYNNNALQTTAGANAYWEQGLNRPDELLEDLITIFHPSLAPHHPLKYYKQLK
ncbi:MAG: ABC transporter substrate-binding protein [Bacteroidetes bacterium]|nr:ABC transporter substrate-binding protein [Bacteroidota bacterium]